MDNFEIKILQFATALKDLYKDEEDRESQLVKMELKEESLTEDFTAMIYAMWALYCSITKDDVDIFGFTHICNRLVLQRLLKDEKPTVE